MSRYAKIRRSRRRAGDPSFDPRPHRFSWTFDWPSSGLITRSSVRFIGSGPVEPMPEGACLHPDPDEWADWEETWPGWRLGESVYGSPLMYFQTAGRLRPHISWGRTEDHVRPQDWGPTALWYADLEVTDACLSGPADLADPLSHVQLWSDPGSHLLGHIERGYPTLDQALGAVAWLRSCVEVAGEAGLLALNQRSWGRHA